MFAVDNVPRRLLQALIESEIAGNTRNVQGLHRASTHQPERGVAGGGDQVVPSLSHQRYHFIRGSRRPDVDLATRVLLERGHPVVTAVTGAALDISGPGDDVEGALEQIGRPGGQGRSTATTACR